MLHGGGRSRDKHSQLTMALMVIGLILAILTPILAEIIKLAVSRQREYLADASGALLTRFPEGLAEALEKIHAAHIPMQRASHATAHLFIANPFAGQKKFFANMFATHPPAEERIKRLRAMIGGG